ncbi:MAG TPA: glycosyltransferase family 2 protein [Candidatus Saccharimonadales bacterium]|nr:glycosyltransferase family 2 protein [Candidatus Saccharimonadales bacterium]
MSINPLKLSIVIPVYNEEDHLKNCLDAIALQSIKPYEVIVVDNNSTDKSVEIAQSYSFVRIVKEKRQGIVHARNRGFNTVRSQIIGRIDADTILPKDWVAKVSKFYANPDHVDYALTGGGFFYNVRAPRLNGWIQGQIAYRFIRLLMGHYSLWGSNMVIPRTLWEVVKADTCSRNDIHEDVDLGIHTHELGYRICYQEGLRVGVYARRIWTERELLWPALARWPMTMRVHNHKAWWVSTAGNALFVSVIVPFGMAAEYIASYIRPR